MKDVSATPTKTRALKYHELADELREQILSGQLQPGYQLPSFARMHAEFGIGQSTLERVYVLLERDGLIERDPGRGTFVARPAGTVASTGIIALLDPFALFDHPYHLYLLRGIQEATRGLELDLLILHDLKDVAKKRVEGLIVSASRATPLLKHLPPGLPAVSVIFPYEGFPSVTADDSGGTSAAIHHLYSLGHRAIGFLTTGRTRDSDAVSKQRLAAYTDTMQSLNIPPHPRWIYSLDDPFLSRDGSAMVSFLERGREKMSEWLRRGWRASGCTALLCQNDEAAVGAIEALTEAGYRVPEDVSVVGFDGTERAEFFRPRLTTVRVPLGEMGAKAVELLHAIVHPESDGRSAPAESIVVPAELRVGESTAPVRE